MGEKVTICIVKDELKGCKREGKKNCKGSHKGFEAGCWGGVGCPQIIKIQKKHWSCWKKSDGFDLEHLVGH